MDERIIRSQDCLNEGAEFLAKVEPRFAHAIACIETVPLRLRPDGFERLLGAIVSQQVSVAAADAIWSRLEQGGMITPDAILGASDEDLRALGLSRQKVKYARALSEANVDLAALRDMPHQDVVKTLTAISGIGIWTAEIYAMFSLARADVFAPGDLALQEAARMLFDLEERPKERAFREMALAWSPWRSVAARVLWAYYAYEKNREGIR